MKKRLICFSLFILRFSFCQAQDTLVLRNGQKMGVKVVSFGNEIIYSMPPTTQQMSIKVSKVSYIKYADGTVSKINNADFNPMDTVKIKLRPYIVFSGGAGIPAFDNGYGGDTYKDDPIGFGYSGYAHNGSAFSVTAGLDLYKGWGVEGMFSNIRNEFDASQILTETLVIFAQDYGGPSYPQITNATAIGTYYYNNYSCLLGINKNIKYKNGSGIGFSILVGEFITQTPALHSIATNDYATASTNPATVNCYFNMNSEIQSNFVLELGMHLDVQIIHHVFLRGLLEFQFSEINSGGEYQFVNMTTGNTAYTGSSGYSLFVGLFNATAGIGYKF